MDNITKKNILINASNLHSGGAVQVAVSFIEELASIMPNDLCISVAVSSEVDDNLKGINFDATVFHSYVVINTYGLAGLFSVFNNIFSKYVLVFTVFGPAYFFRKKSKHIFGFAQSWIIYPNNDQARQLNFFKRLISYSKYYIQGVFFRRADVLIVEVEHVKNRLAHLELFDSEHIYVAHNCVSSVYFDQKRWVPFVLNKDKNKISLGLVTRDYSHKNLSVLPFVLSNLSRRYDIQVEIFVTLTEAEWAARDITFTSAMNNVGPLAVTQCPDFYRQLDGVIFPSLLECFSASPIEAMVMNKPLFASDRAFVRDICGEYINYFDPLDAENIAAVIADYFLNSSLSVRQGNLIAAKNHAVNFSNARRRAEKYIEVIRHYA